MLVVNCRVNGLTVRNVVEWRRFDDFSHLMNSYCVKVVLIDALVANFVKEVIIFFIV